MRWPRAIFRLAIVGLVLLTTDGCLHRDPGVELVNGYEIVAIARSQPCILQYSRSRDPRPYSTWQAGKLDTQFMLVNTADGAKDALEFSSEAEWRQAWRDKRAAPGPGVQPRMENVTGFNRKGAFVFGVCDAGYFLGDLDQDKFELWKDEAEWHEAVAACTGLRSPRLSNPRSLWVQTREPEVWIALAVVALLMTPWALNPLRQRRAPSPPSSAAGP